MVLSGSPLFCSFSALSPAPGIYFHCLLGIAKLGRSLSPPLPCTMASIGTIFPSALVILSPLDWPRFFRIIHGQSCCILSIFPSPPSFFFSDRFPHLPRKSMVRLLVSGSKAFQVLEAWLRCSALDVCQGTVRLCGFSTVNPPGPRCWPEIFPWCTLACLRPPC